MESVLVTGAGGFIGFNLVNELISRDYKIFCLIEKNDREAYEKLSGLKNVEIIDGFDELLNSTQKYPSFKVIYHLASVGVSPEFDNISLFCDVNIKMICQLIDFAKINQSELLVNFGSCFEYGNHGEKLLDEDDECCPESLYAISKNASVMMATQYAKNKDVNLITVRPFGVFGIGEGSNRLAPEVMLYGLEQKELFMTPGEQIRDFVYVKDVVKSIIQLADSPNKQIYEIYNICSNNPVRVKDFVEEIIEVCNLDKSLYRFAKLPYRKNEAMVFAGDNKKLLSAINYDFPKDHKVGIKELFNDIKGDFKNDN